MIDKQDAHLFGTGNRRRFLGSLAALGGVAGLSAFGGETLNAASPIKRNGASHMKLSLAAYSFHRHLPFKLPGEEHKESTMTLYEFIQFCAEQNLDGTELTSYYFPTDVTNEYLMQLKQQTFQLGLDISGTAIGNDFGVAEGASRDAQLKLTRTWIDHAATIGAPVIRIFAGHMPKGDQLEPTIERCVAGINESLDYAAQKGVFLALENHGGITSTPEQLLSIVERVKESPWFGVNLDSGNFQIEDPYAGLEKIAPYAVNAQIKVEMTKDRMKRPADLPRIIGILKRANYRGYVVLEYEAKEEPREAIPEYLKQLRDLIHA